MVTEKESANNRKIIAVLLAGFLLTGLLFSCCFLIENMNHDCMGENCPICLQMEEAVHFIQSMKCISVLSFFMVVLFLFTKWAAHEIKQICVSHTLISLKVEFLN